MVAHWLAGHGALLFFRIPLGRTEEGHLFGNHLHDLMLGAVLALVLASLHAALNPHKPAAVKKISARLGLRVERDDYVESGARGACIPDFTKSFFF